MRFTKDSVVCFLGDSITANGGWIRRVYDHYRLEEKIPCRLYNCGVPGDRAEHGLWRLEETVFCYEPTDVVVAFGMNDSGYTAYNEDPLTERGVMDRRRRLDSSVAHLRAIAGRCAARGIRVTFCTPTVPNELMDSPAPAYPGAAAALVELSLRIRALAEELGAEVIDFTLPFRDMTLKLYKQDLALVGQDRVHPLPEGHELMARLFLRGQGFNVTVPDTWEALHALALQPHDEWENRRYQLELQANCNMYTEWDFGFGKKSEEAMAAAIEAQLALEQRPHIRKRLEDYMTNRPLIPQWRQALIAHTETV